MPAVDEKFVLQNFDDAIENNYIKSYFQPIIRSLTGEICSAETLARWEDPKLGLLAPYVFIDALEREKLIHKLDLKMLDNVCSGCKMLRMRGVTPMQFSVNLSRLDFEQEDLFEQIMAIFEKHGITTDSVHLEITESVMLDNVERFRTIFDRFHKAGFEIWLDDFGSGYTSLNVLKDYNFDVLKIDMKFLSSTDDRSKRLIASVVNTAKLLDIHTLAEGVETKEQATFLRDIGCEMLQGYYYAKPMSKDDFVAFVEGGEHTLEKRSECAYYKKVGMLNFLSSDPLEEFIKTSSFETNNFPIELIELEHSTRKLELPYINKAFMEEVNKMGISDFDAMVEMLNDRTKPFYHDTLRQLEQALAYSGEIKKDYIMGSLLYTFTVQHIASTLGKSMFAATVHVASKDGLTTRYDEINKYGRTLFYNFERVTMMFPESDTIKLVYANSKFKKVYGTVSLRRGIQEFAQSEVHEDDRERYLEFFDLETLNERIVDDDCTFVQQPFRLRTPQDTYRWRLVRITQIPSSEGACYMYSIQRMTPIDIAAIEKMLREYPDMFKK